MKKNISLLLLCLALFVNAQDGTLDTSFGNSGKVDYINTFSNFYDMQLDYMNNKIIAIGKAPSTSQILICRLNWDGTYDTTFDGDGKKEVGFGDSNDAPADFMVLQDGYIVASTKRGSIAKLNFNGSINTSFGNNGFYEYNASYSTYSLTNHQVKLIETTDNKIFIVSNDYSVSATNPIKVHKITASGAFDSTFNSNSVLGISLSTSSVTLNGLGLDNSDNIYISGYNSFASGYPNYVKKVTSNGFLDNTYNWIAEGVFNMFPGFIFDSSDNSAYTFASGYLLTDSNLTNKFFIGKRNSSATNSGVNFGNSGGYASIDIITTSNITNNDVIHNVTGHEINNGADFKIILAGRSQNGTDSGFPSFISLARISSTGILDTTFGTNGYTTVQTNLIASSNYLRKTPVLIDDINGKLYVMGYSTTAVVSLYRFNLSSVLSTKESTKSTLKLYPNPTKSTLNFSEELSEIKILDMSGKQVAAQKEKSKTINVEKLPKGNYLISAKDKNGKTVSEKFIKE